MGFLKKTFLDLLFPRACAACARPVGDEFLYLCWDCIAELDYIRECFCRICGDPANALVGDDWICARCAGKSPAFNAARSAVRYRGIIRNALMSFKYHNAVWLAQDFVLLLQGLTAGQWLESMALDGIVPVPLHPRKERRRTYNQAALLAAGLSRAMGLKLLNDCLIRTKDLGTQTHLTQSARSVNVRDAFGLKKPDKIDGRRLLLVDDVMTTGATANACAQVLKYAGAAAVYVATVARG